ncbi:hypothetical protein N8I77_007245 [Diaporthe amygdali]|uniref:Signal peptidase complex catalytic subunit SEC11 n=1 Tax=Phomopsis amygdali TaxID=1214568 RepID=A0AAD9SB97_PHOAM|nr:hypothetical protein N8I77_007245 [Diaporthe amygdali]
MMWKTLCLVTDSRMPIVCVISESMAPTFHRGDILLLWNRTSTIEVGDIPVVWFEDSHLPMVHRVIKVHLFSKDKQRFLTKGDNNEADDVTLYPKGRTLVSRREVIGFVRLYVPWMGWLVIGFQEIHWIRYLIAAIIGVLCL